MGLSIYPDATSDPIGPTTPTDFTAGSVIFAGAATLAENNASFFWDDVNTQLALTAGAATKTPLLVKGFAAQSANLQEWQNSAGTVLASIASNGFLTITPVCKISAGANDYLQTSSSIGSNYYAATTDHNFYVNNNPIVTINATTIDAGTTKMQMTEIAAPAAPAANKVVLYAQDNGAGKTQLMARFATGASQQIAIEP